MVKKIITAILWFVVAVFRRESKPKQQTAKKNSDIRKAAADKISKPPKSPCIAMLLIMALSGCNRTVYVPEGAALRLREDTAKRKVWIETDGGWIAGKMVIPEGYYCLPLSDEEINNED